MRGGRTRQQDNAEKIDSLICMVQTLTYKVDLLMKQNRALKRSFNEIYEDLVDVNILTATPPLQRIELPPEQIPERPDESSGADKLPRLD